MLNYKKWESIKADFLADPEAKAEYEALRPQYEMIAQILQARSDQGLTQAQLAQRAGTKQSDISRLESGSYNPSLEFLGKVAHGLGKTLHIEFR
jgi:ribosome-binding protein aMBF1 (putative translation factor)